MSAASTFERARRATRKLDQFIQGCAQGRRPTDGYFVEFWRLLASWPEIIAWDRLFDAAKHQVLAESTLVKARGRIAGGSHIEHVNSFNPIFRRRADYASRQP